MKRTLIIIVGLAVGLYGGRLLTQTPPPAPPSSSAQAPAPAVTKVGVVNMLKVYQECKRVKDLKARIENEIKPFKEHKDKLEKLINEWNTALKNADPKNKLTDAQREQGSQVVKECYRQLEDLDFKFKKDVSKRLETDMTALTDYIAKTVKAYAANQGFHLVVGYGEPETALAPALAFRQNVQAIDSGFVRAAYFPQAVDLTNELLTLLNSR